MNRWSARRSASRFAVVDGLRVPFQRAGHRPTVVLERSREVADQIASFTATRPERHTS
ncbi:hypothetical protein OIE43_01965 [Streptomyces pseudovenezuelae]|uniref:hypothetical protein n=1 Tax=Streptomyces pseudovenezuelae TaxID=67350 RepID=UPI002E37341E|nr:hypothetical protein [Streptomyces pseudovenezuelae]